MATTKKKKASSSKRRPGSSAALPFQQGVVIPADNAKRFDSGMKHLNTMLAGVRVSIIYENGTITYNAEKISNRQTLLKAESGKSIALLNPWLKKATLSAREMLEPAAAVA